MTTEPARRLLTKTQLKALRLKPAPGQQPVARYWQGFCWVSQYDADLAVPMRPARAPSTAQLAALEQGRALAGTTPCRACGERVDKDLVVRGICLDCQSKEKIEREAEDWRSVCAEAGSLLALDPLFVDTETTGLDDTAEVVEIAIVDRTGTVLFESLVKSVEPMPPEASVVNGITDEMLAAAPTWPAVAPQVARLLAGRVVIAHNAEFDERMLRQSCRRHSLTPPAVRLWGCSLEMLTGVNEGRWPSLATAIRLSGATSPDSTIGTRHRAGYDAEACRRVIVALASRFPIITNAF